MSLCWLRYDSNDNVTNKEQKIVWKTGNWQLNILIEFVHRNHLCKFSIRFRIHRKSNCNNIAFYVHIRIRVNWNIIRLASVLVYDFTDWHRNSIILNIYVCTSACVCVCWQIKETWCWWAVAAVTIKFQFQAGWWRRTLFVRDLEYCYRIQTWVEY